MPETEKNAADVAESPRLRKVRSHRIATYRWGSDPILVHFVRMGFLGRQYHVIREDAFGLQPWIHMDGSDIKPEEIVMDWEKIKEVFGIELDI